MKVTNTEFTKTFEIVIQLGAILAVLFLYIKRFLVGIDIYIKLVVAFVPTCIIGFFAYKTIKEFLFNPYIVSIALIVGGIALILLDKWTGSKKGRYVDLENISYVDALKIGFFQCISMVPGVSRAAATIIGGIYAGFDRKQATEFSFLLAIPTMFAASGLDLIKSSKAIHQDDWVLLLIGGGVAFVFAALAVKLFIAFVPRYGFRHFGYYRILLGIFFIALSLSLGIKLGI
jgi:undecaprenyl-diphosphatase